jgi:hypothetical protein
VCGTASTVNSGLVGVQIVTAFFCVLMCVCGPDITLKSELVAL